MFPKLSTERLRLRKISRADQQFIFEGLSHPDVIPYYGIQYKTFEATKEQIEWYKTLRKEKTGIGWKMIEKVSGEPIGVITVYNYEKKNRKAEVGFWLLPRYWNKGFAREALQAVFRFWQTEKKLHRMEAHVEVENIASSKLLEKAGFRYEGTMQDCEIKNGRFVSLKIYALIAT